MEAGTILLGKYRVDEVLGTGGMGRVVRASHLYLQQPVAIKVLLSQMAESAETVSRFLREAQATVRLRSEHIARVMDVGTMQDGVPFMVMEFLDGNDLNQILRHHGPQEPSVVCDLMLQACEGMAEAHSIGIVHRDIKPSNFFITRRPDGSMLLKILDFGISKTPVGSTELTGTLTVIGTPTYMSPEQMKSGRAADARSDIWSMGVVMYQLLTGRPPFSGESYPELVLKVGSEPPTPFDFPLPAGLPEVIFRCLEKNPNLRPQNVGELARSLAPFSSDPIQAAQSATRTTRILQQQVQQGQQGLPLAARGGVSTPVPISPAMLTPRSWPPASTMSNSRGQVTHKVRSHKGWWVAATLGLVAAAGVGGYVVSGMTREPATAENHVSAPPPPPASGTPTPTVSGTPTPTVSGTPTPTVSGTPTPTIPPTPDTTAKTDSKPVTAKTDTKTETKSSTPTSTKTETKSTATTKTDTKSTAKTETKTAKTETKSTKTSSKTSSSSSKTTKTTKTTKSGGDDDLFDSRK
ncbi:MAG TPA: serine/threonine-protein kinase [Kofleriaceae bacterium]|nr:serine/threonine-protein kinase [Kofleriaceae bacterium]